MTKTNDKSTFSIKKYPPEKAAQNVTAVQNITYFLEVETEQDGDNKKEEAVICLPFLNQDLELNNLEITGSRFPLKKEFSLIAESEKKKEEDDDDDDDDTNDKTHDTPLPGIEVDGNTYLRWEDDDYYYNDNNKLKWKDLLDKSCTCTDESYQVQTTKIVYPARPRMYIIEEFSKKVEKEKLTSDNIIYQMFKDSKTTYDSSDGGITINATKIQNAEDDANHKTAKYKSNSIDLKSRILDGKDVVVKTTTYDLEFETSTTFKLTKKKDDDEELPLTITRISYGDNMTITDFIKGFEFEYTHLPEPDNTHFVRELESKKKHSLKHKDS